MKIHPIIELVGLCWICGIIAEVRAQPTGFELPGLPFTSENHLVAATVFHWFAWQEGCDTWPPSKSCGQASGLWRPQEGRDQWTGEPDFWVRQIKDIMDANIDIMYVHLYPGMEEQRINLFAAMYQLRRAGFDVPRAVPFLDPALCWEHHTLDLATEEGKDRWVEQYVRFFHQYFKANPDPTAIDYLGTIDGRIMLNTWLMGYIKNHDKLTRRDVQSRLAARLGDRHSIFKNPVYQIATPSFFEDSEYPLWSDQLDRQFATPGYFAESSIPGYVGSYTVKPGVSNQNIVAPGYFLPRRGGKEYKEAWRKVLNHGPIHKRVFIESWNEYDESTGIYAADPGPPFISPDNRSGNDHDVWSDTKNPREYIDTTHHFASLFNGRPARDAEFIGHNLPSRMTPGQTLSAEIVVRNRGNEKWSAAAGFQLTVEETPFCRGPIMMDDRDPMDEIARFGGIFRGRPKIFRLQMTAPEKQGRYDLYFQMQKKDTGLFGRRFRLSMEVVAPAPPISGPSTATE